MAGLRQFVTSYVGLVIGSLVVIVVSMNALAARQTEWQLGRRLTFDLISFAPADLADYGVQTEARSIVIAFENGLAGGLREAVTSLAGTIPAVSQRLIDEVRRDDQARASVASGGGFGLSADAARAVASQAVASAGVVPPVLGGGQPPVAAPLASQSSPSVNVSAPPASTATVASASASPTQTAALGVQQPSPTGSATASPVATRAAADGVSSGSVPTAPAGSSAAPSVVPVTTPAPFATQAAPTQAPPTALVPSVTPAAVIASATPNTPPTATPQPVTAASSPSPTPGQAPSGEVQVTASPTASPTPAIPEFAMDLSVPGGSSVSFQPIFSGALQFKAGEAQTRTINIQNNGTREFRYYLNTSGGSGVLWTDATNGLQMTVSRNGTAVYAGPLSMADRQIGQIARGGQDVLTISVSLPASAGNHFQGQTTTISYNFTAVALP